MERPPTYFFVGSGESKADIKERTIFESEKGRESKNFLNTRSKGE